MKHQNRLTSQEHTHEHQLNGQKTGQDSPLEFNTAEEMLRHDVLHTPVPPIIGQRLHESLAESTPSPEPWWRRLFKRSAPPL